MKRNIIIISLCHIVILHTLITIKTLTRKMKLTIRKLTKLY